MNKIKVHFHVNVFLFGGLEKILCTYLHNMDRNKYEVSLSIGRCMFDLETLKSSIPADVKVEYLISSPLINKVQYKNNKKIKPSRYELFIERTFLRNYSKYLYKKKFNQIAKDKDVIIDFDFYSETLNTNVPIISFLHFSLISLLNWKTSPSSKRYRTIKNKFAKHSKIILLNHDTLDECTNMFPEFRNKYNVVYNPFNIEDIRRLSKLPLDNNYGDYIVSVCRLEESQKDVTTLIKAFNLVVNKYNYHGNLVLVGDGSSRADLEQLTYSLGLKDRVFFVGTQENPFNFMKNAQLFVLSSKFEGFGAVIVEALSVGVPVVASNCHTGPREILNDGVFGELFSVGDIEMLAMVINKVVNDVTLCEHMVKCGLVRAMDFDMEFALDTLYAIIHKTLLINMDVA